MNTTGIIHYGFGADYLKNWGVNEALREIYQNFIDYGDWEDHIEERTKESLLVSVKNGWNPDSLDFLRIGNSRKTNNNSVGKHGEGLKMAFLILMREGYSSRIISGKYEVWPGWYEDKEIGECFCLYYNMHDEPIDTEFTIEFSISKSDYSGFKANLIMDEDLIFSYHYGDIVNREAGNIYSGSLFVARVENLSRAYNIRPEYMELDRDRSVPRVFDVNYYSSLINDAYGKWTAKDTTYSDTSYSTTVPEEAKKDFKPVLVGDDIEFVYENEGEQVVLKNDLVKQALKSDSFFAKAIKKLKQFVAKKLGIYDMLIQFKEKHYLSQDALIDLDIILDAVKNGNNREAA